MSCESPIVVVHSHTFFVLHVGMAKWVFGLMVICCMGTQSHVPRLRMSRLPIIQLLSVWRLRSGDSSFKKTICINHTTTYQSKKKRRASFVHHTQHMHTHTHKHIHHSLTLIYIYITLCIFFVANTYTWHIQSLYIHWVELSCLIQSNTARILL